MYLGLRSILKCHFSCFCLLFRAINHKCLVPLDLLRKGFEEKGEEQVSKESPNSSDWFSQAPKVQKLQGTMSIQQGDKAQRETGIRKNVNNQKIPFSFKVQSKTFIPRGAGLWIGKAVFMDLGHPNGLKISWFCHEAKGGDLHSQGG